MPDGLRVFVEPGPGNSCTRMIKNFRRPPHTCVSRANGQRPFTAVLHGSLDLINAGAIPLI